MFDFITVFLGGISFIYTRFENTHEPIITQEMYDITSEKQSRKKMQKVVK